MELDKIYHMDCLEGMKQIPDGSVDCIICDLPYGTMKGSGEWAKMGMEGNKHDWDTIIPTDQLFEQYERVLRRNGVALLFSQEPYTSHLRTFFPRNMKFIYPLIWLKDSPGNCLSAKANPVSYFEDINAFKKVSDSQLLNPLRDYSKKMCEYIGKSGTKVAEDMMAWGIDAPYSYRDFFSYNAGQLFKLCSEFQYNVIIERYGIDKMEGFIDYKTLHDMNEDFKAKFSPTFNLPEGAKSFSNVLEFPKDTDGLHPTQKPVDLIRRLVLTYSNEGDTILDNCMGSGTTAIACIREHRHFIGFELNDEYFAKASARIEAEQSQLTLNFD